MNIQSLSFEQTETCKWARADQIVWRFLLIVKLCYKTDSLEVATIITHSQQPNLRCIIIGR